MSSTPSRSSSGSSATASSRLQPVLASTRIGPAYTAADGLEGLEVLRPAALDLERGKVGRPRRARSATTAGSSMPIVKSVGGIAAGRPISSWTGRPVTLPTRSWSAMSSGAPCGAVAAIAAPSPLRRRRGRPHPGPPRRSPRGGAGTPPPSSRASRRRSGPGSPPPPRPGPGSGRPAARRRPS